jgi:hypothetical protein
MFVLSYISFIAKIWLNIFMNRNHPPLGLHQKLKRETQRERERERENNNNNNNKNKK